MNLSRIQREIANAKDQFDFVEGHPTSQGSVMVLVALQTARRYYTLEVTFPDQYPNVMPKVSVRTPTLQSSPHRFSPQRNLLHASANVESRSSRSHLCDPTDSKVAEQVRSLSS